MEKMDVDSPNTDVSRSKGDEVKNSDGVEIKINVKANEKNLKRKRTSVNGFFQNKDKETIIAECNKEIDSLLEYYKELSGKRIIFNDSTYCSNNSLIACLLEESSIAFSKLVDAIYDKMNGKEGVTLAYVRSTVLSVGQRMIYGVAIEDADVLEDESESCLWCWETRDIKLLPFNLRGELNARRLGRKKIHERISSLSAILSVLLAIPEDQTNYKTDLYKAFTKLGKTLNLEEIRSVVEKKKQKSNCSMLEKASKLKEKELIHTLQKENLNNEKEKKTLQEQSEKDTKMREKEDAEHKKQLKKQQEEAERNRRRQEKEEAEHQKQLKKQQEEAERNRKRQEKEEAEHQKQLKKQQEEVEKSRKRREKEEAELKKLNSVKKQATILEKFLKANKTSTNLNKENNVALLDEHMQNSSGKIEAVDTIISLMDNALCREDNLDFEDIKKFHDGSWRKLRRNHTSCYWGARKYPKVALVKELKLHELSSSADLFGKVEPLIKEVEQVEENFVDEPENIMVKHTDTVSHLVCLRRKKLLQFDKSNRPAYYGTWSKKSCTVGPRHPFKRDPELDYDVDSDEEWEEEEPGESLSDCEKDTDEDHVEDLKIDDEDESEDGFFVPDGYLSENEGVQVDEKPSKSGNGTINGSDQSEVESEEISELLQQQKYLRSLTEQALHKGHPLVISNLMHEKSQLYNTADAITGTAKMEIRCLQALCMQPCANGIIIDLLVNYYPENEGYEVCESQDQSEVTPSQFKLIISDSDLLEYVKSIQSHSLAMHKILESLNAKFPSTSKSQLRNKVKEISEYIDNQWKVKTEILAKFGLPTDPSVSRSPENQTDVTPLPPKSFLSDSDLLEYVKIIRRSDTLGINKIVDLIHAKFPSTSKSQLRIKVKELSDYVDNCWIVKKEILAKLGLSTTPDKSRTRGIASFFVKKIHPMNQESVNMDNKPAANENASHNNGIEASTLNKD